MIMQKNPILTQKNVITQTKNILSSNIDGETIILSVIHSKYFCMDSIATDIWSFMIEPISIEDVVNKLIKDYNIDASHCTVEVLAFLEILLEKNLIEVVDA
ncbi:MAG TPA: lasso peptide biosynthesis PqqD family chaperone [Rikenellaceae bacterium]|nr:lasso peptide biosynthesis PqqD family chaperone [Rikenellaceae bacterium]